MWNLKSEQHTESWLIRDTASSMSVTTINYIIAPTLSSSRDTDALSLLLYWGWLLQSDSTRPDSLSTPDARPSRGLS
jgi:hypothetical protein